MQQFVQHTIATAWKSLRFTSRLLISRCGPVGRSIGSLAADLDKREVSDLQNSPGAGVSGGIDGQTWKLGKPEFATPATGLAAQTADLIRGLRANGELVILLSDETMVQAVLSFRDSSRDGIAELLMQLPQAGIGRIELLSGDSRDSVARFAVDNGIAEALGDQTSRDKLERIRTLQRSGRRVLMVGDGINDAPTLAAADASLAFADATELAQTHSDFLILGDDIRVVAGAQRLARAILPGQMLVN